MVRAAEHLLLLFSTCIKIFTTLAQKVGQATVATQLDHIGAGWTGRRVAGQRTGMRACWVPLHLALQLAFPTVTPGNNGIGGISHFVTIS